MRCNLDVPFGEHFEAERLGAWWDKENRTWFIRDLETAPFARWIGMNKPFNEPPKQLSARHIAMQKVVVRTGPERVGSCGCDVEPWEDCIHTMGQRIQAVEALP